MIHVIHGEAAATSYLLKYPDKRCEKNDAANPISIKYVIKTFVLEFPNVL